MKINIRLLLILSFLLIGISQAQPVNVPVNRFLVSNDTSNNSKVPAIMLKLKSTKNNIEESSTHLGIDYGILFKLSEKSSIGPLHAIWGFYDFNIANKIMYGKLDVGGCIDSCGQYGAFFTAFGFNYQIEKIDNHLIYLHVGLKGLFGLGGIGLVAIINPKYMFAFNKYIAGSAGLRYMLGLTYSQQFLIPHVGIHFFIN